MARLFTAPAGYLVYITEHALLRYEQRVGFAYVPYIATDLAGANAMGRRRDGLEAFRGTSGVIYLLRFDGLVGCPPIGATVVTVLERGAEVKGPGWGPCDGRSFNRPQAAAAGGRR